MAQFFDLFGDPVPEGRGGRGRPQHIPTNENRHKVSMLLAFGWSNERIAAALRITLPTLRKHYFSELKFREVARDRLAATVAMKLWDGVQQGNVGAIKEFRKLIDENDLMHYGQKRPPQEGEAVPPSPPKLGKKEQAEVDARTPVAGTDLGELMMRRQQQDDPTLN